MWSFDEKEVIDQHFFERRLRRALDAREHAIAEGGLTGFRLCAAESDYLPGVTIDKFDNTLVCQLLSAGAERHKGEIVGALMAIFPGANIYERSDVDVRTKEGLEPIKGVLWGNEPSEPVVIEENGLKLEVDILEGHKTGFYLDQRDSREADDKTYTLDHFFIKLLHIAKSMNTPSAKAEAERRTEYMYAFLEQLKSEIGQ